MVWRVWGKGTPLVLLHGGHGSWTHWLRNIDDLSQEHCLILPDMAGFGDSDALSDPSIDALCDALMSGLEQIVPSGPLNLGAFSFGCTPAGYLASRLGDRMQNLFLLGSWEIGRSHDLRDRFQRWQEAAPGRDRDRAHRNNLGVLMLAQPASIDDLAIRLQSRNTERARPGIRRMLDGTDLRARLATCPCPVICIYGEKDALTLGFLDERRDLVAKLRAGSEMVTIPGAGHWVQYEAPVEVNRLLIAKMRTDAGQARQSQRPDAAAKGFL